MKSTVLFLPSEAVLLVAVFLAATTAAQSPASPPGAGDGPPPQAHIYPAPTNIKVLPKDLTGQQVHEIMEQWSDALGAHCNACHVEDRSQIGPNGRPQLNFADDSKPMKNAARIMFKMTEDINLNYVSMIDSSGAAVACGTCHRGHLGPEPFVAAPRKRPPVAPAPPASDEITLPK